MKKKIVIFSCAVLLFINTNVIAQFTPYVFLGNQFLRTQLTNRGVGVGNFLGMPLGAALHVNTNLMPQSTYFTKGEVFRTDCPAGFDTWWRLQRNATEMGSIFSRAVGGQFIDRDNFSIQASQKDITFHTQPLSLGIGQERMRIVGVQRTFTPPPPLQSTVINAGNVGIGCPNPLTMLHIGGISGLGSGYRTWMDIGTFYSNSSGYDNMYVGLRQYGFDTTDAIINWGNNPFNSTRPDRLRFVFTAATSYGSAASDANGLEAGRVISNGNWSRWGIGDFETPVEDPQNTLDVQGNTVIGSPYAGNINTSAPLNGMLVHGFTGMGMLFTNALVPKRRLDVVEEKDGPQLRLTQSLNANVNDGIFTDFHTDDAGNLMIRPFHNLAPMNVGIDHPGNTALLAELDVNGNGCFRQMPSTTNNFDDVLIDANGVLWRGPANTGTGFGGICGTSPQGLNNNWEIPLNGHNFVFSGQGWGKNCVGIGINGCLPNAKLDVFNDSKIVGGSFVTKCDVDPNYDYIGVYGEVNNIPYGCQHVAGVKGVANGQAKFNSGVWGVALNGTNNMAIYGESTSNAYSNVGIQSTTSNGYKYNFGINSEVTGNSAYINYGIRSNVLGNNTTINYGIYSRVSGSNSINYAGYFVGDIYVSGTTSGTGYVYASDMKLKKDTVKFNNGLETIRNIQPYSFKYNGLIGINNKKQHTGVIAEQVAQYAPFAIDTLYAIADTTDSVPSEFLGVKNEAILFTSINAIKQLDSITTSISDRIDTLKDNDWYKMGTTSAPTNINDDKYTFGNAYINVPTVYFPAYPYIRFAVYQNTGLLDTSSNSMMSITARFHNEYAHQQDESAEYGLYSEAVGAGCDYRSSRNYASYFKAKNAMNNYAGYFDANSSCANSMNYGVYSVVPAGVGYAGFFDGNVQITGSTSNLSDVRFKTNIVPISSALDLIDRLNPVHFNFVSQQGVSLPTGNQYGMVAQDVEPVLPDVVTDEIIPAKYDTLGNMISDTVHFKGLKYNAFISIALKGIQELKHENDSLKQIIQHYDSRLNAIENMLSQCCSENKSTTVSVTVQTRPVVIPVSDKTVLNQNQPNPFQTITTFSYVLGEEGNVQLVIDDTYGHHIATLVSEYQTKGNYSIDWDASRQLAGLYFYSLMVNGKVLVKKAIKIE